MEATEAQRIDAQLAELSNEAQMLSSTIGRHLSGLHHATGDRKQGGYGARRTWQVSDQQAVNTARELVAADKDKNLTYGLGYLARTLDALTACENLLAQTNERMFELDDIYRADPWSRFFLVTSSDGHIHSSMNCSTCRITTTFGWLPQLSGKTEADAVADQGPFLCSVCFPTAPVEHRQDRADVISPARAARDAERAERAAKLARKNLTEDEKFTIDRGRYGEHIETVAACKEALRKEVEFRDYYGHGEHCDHAAWAEGAKEATRVLLAREARQAGTGATQAEIDKIIENAVKRNRKDGARI